MGDWKYVNFGYGNMVIVFPPHAGHDELRLLEVNFGPITSAGFVRVGEDRLVSCYGKSESLKVESDQEMDSRLIGKLMR